MHGALDEPALQWRGVRVRYGSVIALDGVDLAVNPGELVALVGPNGAGKTTLMHAALGLVQYEGSIVVHRESQHGVAFVPQRHGLQLDFPLTARQVVEQGRRPFLRFARGLRETDQQVVRWALQTVGAAELGERLLHELSGGQLQRVLFARALAQEARILLLDEPFAGVDEPTAQALVSLLTDLAAAGTAIVVSTHDLQLVRDRFSRCVLLGRHVRADGDPAEVLCGSNLEHLFLAA